MKNKTNIQKITLKVGGMYCASCAQNIENSLKELNGVVEANVSFVNSRAVVKYDETKNNLEKIKEIIKGLGYAIEEPEKKSIESLIYRYISNLRVIVVGLLLLLSWLAGAFGWQLNFIPVHWRNLGDLFAILTITIGWWPILKNAIKTILSKSLNVKVLVSIAVVASLFIGAYKEAATVIFIVILAHFLESFAVGKASQAIKKLMELVPKKARVKRDGKEIMILAKDVRIGDIVIIKPGEQVAIDGELLGQEAQVDQSVITGESMPVAKIKGKKILAGSISDGCYFEIRATQVGEDTTLAHIQKLVEEAQSKKAPIQSLTDKFAGYFVPIALLIAFLIGVFTLDLTRAITILIVACPCAFVIAPPVSIIAAIGRGAKRGILIKGGQYLEALGEIDTVIFDKTGTLTEGKPRVIEIKRFKDHSEKEIIGLIAILESKSEHHLAQAILQKAAELQTAIKKSQNIKIIKGRGVVGEYNGKTIYFGNLALMRENKIEISGQVAAYVEQEEAKGHTVNIVAHDNSACGVVCISDKEREEAKTVIKNLRKTGIENIWLMTGDNKIIAQNTAQDLGIDKYFAEMLPQDKIDQIQKLQKEGKKVIMIGDGINDAPALVQADVGIAMGSGTDIAIESGHIALMKDDLTKIPEAIELGRKTLTIIKQNMIFTIGFNLLMFLLASLAIIHMTGGAVFHQINSLIVILNAMRLLKTE
jgi:heavy metal translocating P-type ATPase